MAKRKKPKMRWLVRANCEYSTTVEADTAEEAIEKADNMDLDDWESAAWSDFEAEEAY